MKIVIIGARGMLGQALAREFESLRPLLWDKEDVDVTEAESVKRKVEGEKPDVIINCAAYTDVDGCEDNQALAFKLNGEAVVNLAEVANGIGATLVQYSTAYVFDGRSENGYKEDALPAPLSVYGQSKLAGEKGAASAKKYYILRLDRLFGRPGAGKKSFVDKILEAALVRKQLEIIDEEEGCPTYAPDLAKVTRKILEEKYPYGIYHTANSGSCTWFGFAEAIFKIAGIGVELKPIGSKGLARKAERPKFAALLNSKLPPARPWREALEDYLNQES